MIKNNKKTTFSIFGYLIFLITNCVLISLAFLVYNAIYKTGNNGIIAIVVLSYIVIASLLATIIDFFRRKHMIELPLNDILDTTNELIKGNYDVELKITHCIDKYDEFDLIKENINLLSTELKNTNIMHNDFISNISHEIKTPIAIIKNYVKLLENDKLSNDEKTKCVSTITSATTRLNNLVQDMLKLNKLENQGILPEIEHINLYDSISESIISFEDVIEKKRIELDCDLADIEIYSIPSYLEIIWNNLISNAVKFTDNGGKISISLQSEEDKAVVRIKDTGCGISKEAGEHIFDKFYQADTSHSKEGNGLGLALVKRIIDLIGGAIYVESVVNEGTTFTVKLDNQLTKN